MFHGTSNIQLAVELLKIHYKKVSVMRGVEHIVSLFLNDFSKIPVLNQMITDSKGIYNLFGSVIYYKKVSVMRGVEHIVSLFLNDFSKIPFPV